MSSLSKTDQIAPNEPNRFREWADRECGRWPADLQIKAWDAAHGKITIAEFVSALHLWRG